MTMTTRWRERNPDKHEYEVQRGSSHLGAHIYVGTVEKKAVKQAAHLLQHGQPFSGETHVRLYHSHPSPGPLRRYVGRVTPDGKLHLAR